MLEASEEKVCAIVQRSPCHSALSGPRTFLMLPSQQRLEENRHEDREKKNATFAPKPPTYPEKRFNDPVFSHSTHSLVNSLSEKFNSFLLRGFQILAAAHKTGQDFFDASCVFLAAKDDAVTMALALD